MGHKYAKCDRLIVISPQPPSTTITLLPPLQPLEAMAQSQGSASKRFFCKFFSLADKSLSSQNFEMTTRVSNYRYVYHYRYIM